MHELGICDALLKMVRGIMKDEELTEVEKITVEVGSLSGVVPKFLADCWVAVADGTELEKTRDWHAERFEEMPIKVAEHLVKRTGKIARKAVTGK